MTSPIVSKLLIHIHLKSWQSVTSSNNQTCKLKMFLWIFNIIMKSVIFFNGGTFTRMSSVQDERDILK